MFNATKLRAQANTKQRLDSYLKRNGFRDILNGLIQDGVSENEIMMTTRGRDGCTMLHDAFFIDFCQWIGGVVYYRAVKRFVSYPKEIPSYEQTTV